VAAVRVEAGGAAGPVLTVELALEPPQLLGLVVQLGTEGLLPGALLGDHGDGGGADVQADQPLADPEAHQRRPVQDELGGEGPAALDAGPHDSAKPQPALADMPGRPPVVRVGLVEGEGERQALAPLQSRAVP
jgi:hypothetical protein